MSDRRKYWLGICKRLFIIGLVASIILFVVQVLPALRSGSYREEYNDQWSMAFPQNTSLTLSLYDVEVHIEGSETDRLEAVFAGWYSKGTKEDTPRIELVQDGSEIILAENDTQLAPINLGPWTMGGLHGTLVVRVPKARLGNLTIDTFSGSIDVSTLHAQSLTASSTSGGIQMDSVQATGEMAIDTFAGSISLYTVTAQNLIASTTSGSVKANTLRAADTLNVDTFSGGIALEQAHTPSLIASSTSGSVRAELETEADVDISTFSGGVSLTLPKHSSFTYSADSFSGSIDVGFSHHGDHSHGAIGNGVHHVAVSTTSGDIHISPAH